jgi:cytochrome P450
MRSIPAPLTPTALQSDTLVMPGDDLPAGPTRDLRRAMARFSDGRSHAAARSAVVDAIGRVDVEAVAVIAERRARSRFERGHGDAAVLVPAATMAEALGLLDPGDDGVELVSRLIVIGDALVQGVLDPAADTEAATSELIALARPHGDPTAIISVLHQVRGATGALIDLLVDRPDPAGRPSAVPATKRTAASDTTIGDLAIAAGETVAIELDVTTEFGIGRHACPGRAHAEAITSAVVAVLSGA